MNSTDALVRPPGTRKERVKALKSESIVGRATRVGKIAAAVILLIRVLTSALTV